MYTNCDLCNKEHNQDDLINLNPELNYEIQDLQEAWNNFDGMVCKECYDKMVTTNKSSFTEIVDKFTEKFGVEWCADKLQSETVVDIFIDYIKSMALEQFNYEKVYNLK